MESILIYQNLSESLKPLLVEVVIRKNYLKYKRDLLNIKTMIHNLSIVTSYPTHHVWKGGKEILVQSNVEIQEGDTIVCEVGAFEVKSALSSPTASEIVESNSMLYDKYTKYFTLKVKQV